MSVSLGVKMNSLSYCFVLEGKALAYCFALRFSEFIALCWGRSVSHWTLPRGQVFYHAILQRVCI